MAPKLPDPMLNRLLAGRDELTQSDKDAVLDEVLGQIAAEPAAHPAPAFAPWLRWALVGLGVLLVAAPASYWLASRKPADQFTARGGGSGGGAGPGFSVRCAQDMAEGRCALGGKLLFRVEPDGARFFSALSVDEAGAAVWYFTGLSLQDLPADGLLGVGVTIDAAQGVGRRQVVGVFTDRAPSKEEIRALLDKPAPGAALVRRPLEVVP